jgi:TonB-dependent receptor-like protein
MRCGTTAVLLCALAFGAPSAASAQSRGAADTAFRDLEIDGSGVAALGTRVTRGFDGIRASAALRTIAELAGVSITFDPDLRALGTGITIAAHDRTAAAAMLEVAAAAGVRVRVSRGGQIVVLARTAGAPAAAATTPALERDTLQHDTTGRVVTLPAVKSSATLREREMFENTTNVGGVSITERALAAAPQFVEPDVLRSVQTLPGVAARSDYVAGFNLRGGEADQTLVLLDGYPIYSPFHLGGVFSTFIDAAVDRVDLRTGSMPAEFGGRLSGVLDVRSAEPARDKLQGTAEVSLVSSSASIGRAFGDGSWNVAARRTYADAVVDLFKPGAFPYHFQDVEGHVAHSLPGGLRLAATAYAGEDVTATEDSRPTRVIWGNALGGLTLSRAFARPPALVGAGLGDSLVIEQRASFTRFNAIIDDPDRFISGVNDVSDVRVGGSVAAYGARFTQRVGYELAAQRFLYDANPQNAQVGDLLPFDSVGGSTRSASVYADELWRASSSFLVDAGARIDAVSGQPLGGVSPRLSVKYFLRPNLALTAATGVYRQWIHSLGREEEPVEPLQFWIGSDTTRPVSRARDAVLGLERWMTPARFIHIEGFYKRYDDLLVPNPFSDPIVRGDEFNVVGGSSYGADLLLRQLDIGGPFSGWLAYSYGVSTRVTADGERYFPVQDRRHDVNAVGSWRAGRYLLGARFHVASGAPYTPVLGAFIQSQYDPIIRRWVIDPDVNTQASIAGAHNSARVPWYGRLDVSVKRVAHLRGATVTPYFSIVNVLNMHNPAAYLFDFGRQPPRRASFPNLPFVPTFGVSVAY